MADICSGVVSEGEAPARCDASSRAARRRRLEIRRFKFVAGVTSVADGVELELKRRKVAVSASTTLFPRGCKNTMQKSNSDDGEGSEGRATSSDAKDVTIYRSPLHAVIGSPTSLLPKFGISSVCGRRRDMEDAVAVYPSFFHKENDAVTGLHYFAVYDGHGCSHVAMRCRERLHELVKEELLNKAAEAADVSLSESVTEWKEAMERSFNRMDKEVVAWNVGVIGSCRCELQTPECDAVGSTAVVAVVTPEKIIIANCGDSRAVLCRNGKAFPLSSDHKPDRPDEMKRIQEAGGRVIYWEGPRVLGVLALSRAIGDNYLKPYVISEPEVTIIDRTADDDCLILASDGLWDVVSNDTACGVARMCLQGKVPKAASAELEKEAECGSGGGVAACGVTDKACSDASTLLSKLALARHSSDNVSVVVVDVRKNT